MTFVQFKIIDVIAGQYDGDTFTLRYIGGPKNADQFLIVTHVNNFNIGDEEIVSINGNGYLMDPVIGRFRVFNDSVYTASGLKILTDEASDLIVSSEKMTHETLSTIQIGQDLFPSTNNLPIESPDIGQAVDQLSNGKPRRPMNPADIKKMVKEGMKNQSRVIVPEVSASTQKHRNFSNTKR